jgi:hypothetical protein
LLNKKDMIAQLIDILNLQEYYGESKTIDIAKGRYENPTTWKSAGKLIKRIWYGRNNKN